MKKMDLVDKKKSKAKSDSKSESTSESNYEDVRAHITCKIQDDRSCLLDELNKIDPDIVNAFNSASIFAAEKIAASKIEDGKGDDIPGALRSMSKKRRKIGSFIAFVENAQAIAIAKANAIAKASEEQKEAAAKASEEQKEAAAKASEEQKEAKVARKKEGAESNKRVCASIYISQEDLDDIKNSAIPPRVYIGSNIIELADTAREVDDVIFSIMNQYFSIEQEKAIEDNPDKLLRLLVARQLVLKYNQGVREFIKSVKEEEMKKSARVIINTKYNIFQLLDMIRSLNDLLFSIMIKWCSIEERGINQTRLDIRHNEEMLLERMKNVRVIRNFASKYKFYIRKMIESEIADKLVAENMTAEDMSKLIAEPMSKLMTETTSESMSSELMSDCMSELMSESMSELMSSEPMSDCMSDCMSSEPMSSDRMSSDCMSSDCIPKSISDRMPESMSESMSSGSMSSDPMSSGPMSSEPMTESMSKISKANCAIDRAKSMHRDMKIKNKRELFNMADELNMHQTILLNKYFDIEEKRIMKMVSTSDIDHNNVGLDRMIKLVEMRKSIIEYRRKIKNVIK